MEHKWKNIKNFENYEVSDFGEVRNKITNKILTPFLDKYGYHTVNIYNNKKLYQKFIHRLVAEAFIPNPDNLPQVNHKNEIKTCNLVNNLEWCNAKYNTNYGNRNKKISKKVNQYDLQGNFIQTWNSIMEVEKNLNIFHSRIIEVCKGKRKSIGGFIWKYEGDDDE